MSMNTASYADLLVMLAAKDKEIAELRANLSLGKCELYDALGDVQETGDFLGAWKQRAQQAEAERDAAEANGLKALAERDEALTKYEAAVSKYDAAVEKSITLMQERDEARECVRRLCKFVQFLYHTYPDPIRGGCESALEATPAHLR